MDNINGQLYSISELAKAPRCTHVEVFTERNLFKGYTTHAIDERFLDILNQGSKIKPKLIRDFLHLFEVEIYDLSGRKEEVTANCLLNKNNIWVVAESRIAGGELPPSKPFKYTSFRRKKPVSVNIHIQDLTVVGQVYINQDGESITALEMDNIFIPVTNATLVSKSNYSYFEFVFIAVNKNQITSISELSKSV